MPTLLICAFAAFDVSTFTVQAPGRHSARSVLTAFLNSAPIRGTTGVALANRFGVDDCRPQGCSGKVPLLEDTWQDWCAFATAVHIGKDLGLPGLRLAGTASPARKSSVEFTTGPDSGFTRDLPPGEWTIGRTSDVDQGLADEYLSRKPLHVTNGPGGLVARSADGIEFSVPLHNSSPSTMMLGSTRLSILPSHSHRPAGSLSFEWPVPPEVRPPAIPSWWYYVLPLVLGIVLVAVTGMWWFLLFTLSGPLTAGLTWAVEKRRYARESRQSVREYRQELTRFLGRVSAQADACLDDSRAIPLGAGLIIIGYGQAVSPLAVCDHPLLGRANSLRTRWGAGLEYDPRIVQLLERHTIRGQVLEGVIHPILDDAPLCYDPSTVDLDVRGPTAEVCDVMRYIVASVWKMGRRVEFTQPPSPRALPEFLVTGPTAGAVAAEATTAEAAIGTFRTRRVIGESTATAEARASPLAVSLVHGEGVTTASFRPGSTAQRVEPVQRWLVDCHAAGSTGELSVPDAHPGHHHPVPLGGTIELRRLRPERFLALVPASARGEDGRPPTRSLADLLDTQSAPARWAQRWKRPSRTTLDAPLGSSAAGPVIVDLVRDGPHALVAGTTGSGKSVLLQTWVTAMAAAASPAELRFVLIDFKGGATFAPFARLSHVDSIVHNLEPAQALRALRSLRAEILRREALLADSGAGDIEEFNSRADRASDDGRTSDHGSGLLAAHRLPRIAVMIDEFQALMQDNPAGVEMIESLTALGRSLGIHLVLSTQRPTGTITSRMKANINLRIALRVRDAPDSIEIIETDRAAALSSSEPGMAYLSRGAAPEFFRVAPPELGVSRRASRLSTGQQNSREVVQWTRVADELTGRVDLPAPDAEPGDLLTVPALIDASVEFSARAQRPACIVLPPLPRVVEQVGPCHLGLLDFPDEIRTADWFYDADRDGSVIITGGHGHGTSTTVRALASAAAARGHHVVCLGTRPTSATGHVISAEHSELWAIEYLLGWLESALSPLSGHSSISERSSISEHQPTNEHQPTSGLSPLMVCIDDFDALRTALDGSRRLSRLEKVLTASSGGRRVRFVIAAGRRILHSSIAAHARTRIVFPPADAQETVHFALRTQRFSGDWPPGRAVVLGPAAAAAGPEGADVQLAHMPDDKHSENSRPRSHPDAADRDTADSGATTDPAAPTVTTTAWFVAQPAAGECDDAAAYAAAGIVVGVGPCGELVRWDPMCQGPVLSVRGTEIRTPHIVQAIKSGWRTAHEALPLVAVPEAHRADPSQLAAGLTAAACVVGYPLHHTPGYASPLAKAPALGPMLVVGPRTTGELAEIGLRELPVVPGPPTRGWFVTAERAVPVDVAGILA